MNILHSLGLSCLALGALLGAAGCDAQDPARQVDVEDATARLAFRFPTLRLTGDPGSGRRLNTNRMGTWEFSTLVTDASAPVPAQGARLVAVETGSFAPNMPWEVDEVGPHQGVDVSSLALEHHALTGELVGGQRIQHSDFHDSRWTVRVDDTTLTQWELLGQGVAYRELWEGGERFGEVDLRLTVGWSELPEGEGELEAGGDEDDRELDYAIAGAIPLYTFWFEKDGRHEDDQLGWFETCAVPQGAGLYSTTAVLYEDVDVLRDGRILPMADSLYIGCVTGAVGKAATWGYWPDEMTANTFPQDSLLNFETTVRMIRADYCGDGTSYTREGTPLGVADRLLINQPGAAASLPEGAFEAVWYAGGADCVNFVRDPTLSVQCRPRCSQLDAAGTFAYFQWPAYTHFVSWR